MAKNSTQPGAAVDLPAFSRLTEGAQVPRVLSIAGIDPSGGAGIFADLKSIAALGGYGMGAVSAITAQNTVGVQGVFPQPISVLRAQLDSIAADVEIDAVKIGMLGEAETVAEVGMWLDQVRPPIVVLDPVMVATTGGKLSSDEAIIALAELARKASLITPNVPELGVLAGEETAEDIATVRRQAIKVAQQLGVAVLATTGDLADQSQVDILVAAADSDLASGIAPTAHDAENIPGCAVVELPFSRIDTKNTHGTGCSMSAALATAAVTESSWENAYARLRPWLDGALRGGLSLGVGQGNGPLDHNWLAHPFSEE